MTQRARQNLRTVSLPSRFLILATGSHSWKGLRSVIPAAFDYPELAPTLRRGYARAFRGECQRRIDQVAKRPNPIRDAKLNGRVVRRVS